MKIKKYTGISLASIFAKVKSDLGEKAIILSTKKVTSETVLGMPKIEVTAALSPPVFEKAVLPQKTMDEKTCHQFLEAVKDRLYKQSNTAIKEAAAEKQKQSGSNPVNISAEIIEIKEILKDLCLGNRRTADPRINKIKKTLKASNVDEDIIMSILGKINTASAETAEKHDDKKHLENMISEHITAQPYPLDLSLGNVVIVLGTTGVGKTTTLAKLASIVNLQHNKPVAFITADSFRAGAAEHLQKYAKILDAPFRSISKNESLLNTVEELQKDHIVFIDSSGFSQYNKLKIRELHTIIRDIERSTAFLLLSASTHPAEMKRTLKNFCSIIDIKGLILTKIDETEKPGHILSIGRWSPLPFFFITDGQIVPDNIHMAESALLARKILYGQS